MKAVVYDAGVLIAADRSARRIWAEQRVRLEAGSIPLVPAPVLAQVSRSPRQAELRRFLRGCEVVAFDEAEAHRAGALLGTSRTTDVVDASVVVLATRERADITTDDPHDLARLVTAARARLSITGI